VSSRADSGLFHSLERLDGVSPHRFRGQCQDAPGGAGELGLMQVTEAAAQEWADARRDRNFEARHLLHPSTNLHAGCFYLAKVTRRYLRTDHPYAYALADYNAGRGNVLRWMNDAGATNASVFLAQMTFPGTRDYVRTILARCPTYRDDFPTATRP
jgi:soluble lytic murein transglycosylase